MLHTLQQDTRQNRKRPQELQRLNHCSEDCFVLHNITAARFFKVFQIVHITIFKVRHLQHDSLHHHINICFQQDENL